MAFEIYIPENLKFSDYIAVLQTTRTWADGYDRKVDQIAPPPQTDTLTNTNNRISRSSQPRWPALSLLTIPSSSQTGERRDTQVLSLPKNGYQPSTSG